MRIGDRRQWYLTVTVSIPDVKHKVRIVILWRYKKDEGPCTILVTDRITWGRRSRSTAGLYGVCRLSVAHQAA
jgi:hypothetical protein